MNIFKKITTGVLALTIGMCVIPSAVSASMNESYRKGDIDGDGDVDNVDSAYLANFLSGIKGSANDQMSQRLDVDLSGIIDKHDKTILSSMIANGSGPIYYNYETSNLGIPSQSTIEYRKYNAQTDGCSARHSPWATIRMSQTRVDAAQRVSTAPRDPCCG